MGLEGATYPLYISFPYAAKAAMAGMPFGYRFFAAYLQGPFEVMPGTTALRKQLIFKCIRHWTGNHLLNTMTPGVPPVNARLYDHDMGGLPAIS